jgi:hypothetical protein
MAAPTWLDKLSGQVLRIAGVTKSPTSKIWNFVSGVTAVYNAATGAWDLTVTGGGGGTGNVTGLGSSVAHRLAAFADTTGKLLEQTAFLAADILLRNGSVPLTGDLDLGGNKATNSGAPSAAGDLATKAYVDAIAAGLSPRPSVKAIATSNQATMTGTAQTIDGVALNTVGDRVLLTAQSTATQNGPWVIAAGAWTRPVDFPAGSDAAAAHFFVQQGTTYAETGWVCSSNTGSAVVDTNNLAFVQFSAAGVPLAGNGLSKTGQVFAVVAADTSVTVSGSGVKVSDQLPARGGENVALDLYPSVQVAGGITNAAPVVYDYAIPSGKHLDITAKVFVNNGLGGPCLYLKKVNLTALQTSGAAVIAGNDVVVASAPLEGGNYTFTVTVSTTNVRFTLTKTNGGTDSYNIIAGDWRCDLP